jgi:PleD family two-component response regulator
MRHYVAPLMFACSFLLVRSLQVLVVEDHLLNQRLVEAMLKRLGHTSTMTADGQLAIDMATAIDAGTQKANFMHAHVLHSNTCLD